MIFKVMDDYRVGDLYSNEEIEGRILDITPDFLVLESVNEDGDVENVEVPIEDAFVDLLNGPSEEDLDEVYNTEFLIDMIESATDFDIRINQYQENEDGTLAAYLDRPLSEKEINYLFHVGIPVDTEAAKQGGWVTFGVDVTDSFITDDLEVGEDYNDGEHSGKVVSIDSDELVIESEDEDGNVIQTKLPVKDSFMFDYYSDEDLYNIQRYGETFIEIEPGVNPNDVLDSMQIELEEMAAPKEFVPDLDVQPTVWDENNNPVEIRIFTV